MLSRRSLLAGIGIVGAGAAAAGARLLTGSDAVLGSSTPTGFASAPAPSPSPLSAAPAAAAAPSTAASAAPAATASASVSASASASASAAAVAASPSATPSPTPVASRAMPGASPSATADASPAPSATTPTERPSAATTTAYASGASCIGAADGRFGSWRGRPVAAASTWGRDGETYVVERGGEYGSWGGDLDYAPQYDLERTGSPFTWQAMAAGAYDARLRTDLQRLKACWGDKPGTLYYRFQHEFNGDWYRWSVDESNAGAMTAGWRRMAGVFRGVFGNDPRFRIAWSPNAGSDPKKYRDIRSSWPGADVVDVISIDYYDFFKPAGQSDWNRATTATDSGGGPVGIGAWQRFAARAGVPWAVAEWGNQYGDNPLYIQKMHDFFTQHAYSGSGSAAGKLVYEVYFNQVFDGASVSGGGDFRVQVDGRDHAGRPNAARRYRELFGA